MKPIKTRFAPSPTGWLHIGGLRTALYSWAFAKKHGGEFLLRIEDSDKARSTQESLNAILSGLAWAGLHPNNADNILLQSRNMPRYHQLLQQLLDEGKAYYCYCSTDELEKLRENQLPYDRRWRTEKGKTLPPVPDGVTPVIRFKTPIGGTTSWIDGALGEIAIANENLDDFIIARSDGSPVYNFCVVADDADMGISHVIRGDDHVNNTPKQILLYQALGFDVPQFVHLPMILNADGKKLSKRNKDTVAVSDFANKGILPEALLNYLARLGWGKQNQEIFTMPQFIEMFDLKDISHAAARSDEDKLRWINGEHIKNASNDRLALLVRNFTEIPADSTIKLNNVLDLFKDRVQDIRELAAECQDFYRQPPKQPDSLPNGFITLLENLDVWTASELHTLMKSFCRDNQIKMAALAMPLRLAVCGKSQTPSIDRVLAAMGKEEVLSRLR